MKKPPQMSFLTDSTVSNPFLRYTAIARSLCLFTFSRSRLYPAARHVSDGRTLSGIRKLDDVARVKEIARMLGGGESALPHAEDMLKQAAKARKKK